MTLHLRPFQPDDDRELIAWFPDAAALRMFAGDTLAWPLDRSQLDAIRADESVAAWTAWNGAEHAVYPSNAPAVRLYRSMGFEDQAGGADRPDVLRMARNL